ncbi:MAG TPA: hypothetical protein VFT22_18765, partial [Kofleriaceae bacterium]|nr:hypothetical protein [Kofleriaceae bacterium]
MPRSSAAVLVVAHGVDDAAPTTIHTLGQIGEALLATATPWQIRLLTPAARDRMAADRAGIKRHLAELADQDLVTLLIGLAGYATEVGGDPALVTGPDHRALPDEATLPLGWIRDHLRACRAQRVVVIASLAAPGRHLRGGPDRAWLDALGTARPAHLIAVEPSGPRGIALAALRDGLSGAAVDPQTGTITLRSLGAHLAQLGGMLLQPSE